MARYLSNNVIDKALSLVDTIEEDKTSRTLKIGAGAQLKNVAFVERNYVFNLPPQSNDEDAQGRYERIKHAPEQFYQSHAWGNLRNQNPHFAGRTAKLTELTQAFASSTSSTSDQGIAAVLITGLGGIGKTQLATEFIYQLEKEEEHNLAEKNKPIYRYALKIWLRGAHLKDDIRNLAIWLGIITIDQTPAIEEIARMLYAHLAKLSEVHRDNISQPSVLIVLDDVNWSEELKEILPQSYARYRHCFHWLITSREHKGWTRYFADSDFKLCDLKAFTKDESLLYFDKALNTTIKAQVTDYMPEKVKALAKQLGYLPLALSQAAAYINRR
ncbi:MAG: AAA family ATPase, partial [Gammaproteobacteria bacterium]